jgi:integrase
MARKRRGSGEGSIYQRKDGRWVASMSLEHRKRKYFYGDTRREVQEKLKIALREQQQGTLVTARQQTVKQFLERWVEEVYKPTVKLVSYVDARSIINHHLIPAFGHVSLQKLTPEMIHAVYRQKLDEGLKPATIGCIHKFLCRALEDAVKFGLVARNVSKLVTLPRIERYEAQALTLEQAEKLLEAARGMSIETLLLLALTTGMRRGELLALRWVDVDFVGGTVFVHRTVARVGNYGLVENEPKTKSSRRRIVLPSVAIEALRKHQSQQEQLKMAAGDSWHDKGIVFSSASGGFIEPVLLLRWFDRLLTQAALPRIRFHDLRHSAATILLATGVNPKEVQERLGHSSIVMTMDVYGHVIPSMHHEAANKIDDLFKHP